MILNDYYLIGSLFVTSFIFSLVAYWDKHIGEVTKSNKVKLHTRGALHAFLGALVGVTIYALQLEHFPDSVMLLKVALSIVAAVVSDSILLKGRQIVEGFNVR